MGRLVDRLKAVGLFDKALLIVTADHGASFRPGGYFREVEPASLADIAGMHFVKYPHQRAAEWTSERPRRSTFSPTIADVVGVTIPWDVDGRSLRSVPVSRRVAIAGHFTPELDAHSNDVNRAVLATAKRNARLFGTGRDSLYRIGPFDALHGRSVTSFTLRSSRQVTANLFDDAYEDVRPRRGSSPRG